MALVGRGAAGNPKQTAIAAIAQAQADLERAVEELDKLPALDIHSIALAAHALNNFLTVSRGVVELLIPLLRHHPERQIAVWLEGLSHANDLMSHTVSQLMNNTVSSRMTLHIEDVELTRLVERACAYHRRPAERRGVNLVVSTERDLPLVRTDRVVVAAVLDNLLSNAVKYSFTDTRIWVDLRKEREGIVCSVRDEGPGLSQAEQDHLFLPGAGGEPSMGYGLAIAKRFVDDLSGELTCTSAQGQGTIFSLWLPSAWAGP